MYGGTLTSGANAHAPGSAPAPRRHRLPIDVADVVRRYYFCWSQTATGTASAPGSAPAPRRHKLPIYVVAVGSALLFWCRPRPQAEERSRKLRVVWLQVRLRTAGSRRNRSTQGRSTRCRGIGVGPGLEHGALLHAQSVGQGLGGELELVAVVPLAGRGSMRRHGRGLGLVQPRTRRYAVFGPCPKC